MISPLTNYFLTKSHCCSGCLLFSQHNIKIKILHLTSSQSNSENAILAIINTLVLTQPLKIELKWLVFYNIEIFSMHYT